MKRLIFTMACLLIGLINFDENQMNVAQAMEVNTENLSTWLGSQMALNAAVNGGKQKENIIKHCNENKQEKSIEAACMIATRL